MCYFHKIVYIISLLAIYTEKDKTIFAIWYSEAFKVKRILLRISCKIIGNSLAKFLLIISASVNDNIDATISIFCHRGCGIN